MELGLAALVVTVKAVVGLGTKVTGATAIAAARVVGDGCSTAAS
ncbi:hypothetical protein [Sphingomonas faeni]